jgi:aspartate/tyrosine/aromatic aminotransferase
MTKRFHHLEPLPDDPLLSLTPLYSKDQRKQKINLGIGTYRDTFGSVYIPPVVKEAETIILSQPLTKEYQPIEGNIELCRLAAPEILGKSFFSEAENRIIFCQTLGGSGALRIGGELVKSLGIEEILLPSPSWINHKPLLTASGLRIIECPYYDEKNHTLLTDRLFDSVKKAKEGTAILLQTSCHNPTGMDLSQEEWQELSYLIIKHRLFPFFDSAYQGFGFGFMTDRFPLELFANKGHEMLIAYSFSKNMGLYGERLGLLGVIAENQTGTLNALSHIKRTIRRSYSTPPLHSARIAQIILERKKLKLFWNKDLDHMRQRLTQVRNLFAEELSTKTGKDFQFITKGKGLFSLLEIQPKQADWLRAEWGVYIPSDGRINIAGLNEHNISRVVQAFSTMWEKE